MASANFYPFDGYGNLWNSLYNPIDFSGDVGYYQPLPLHQSQSYKEVREIGTDGVIDHASTNKSNWQTAVSTNITIKINGQPVGALQNFSIEASSYGDIKLDMSRIRYDRMTMLDVIGAKDFHDAWNHPFEISIEDKNNDTITTFSDCRMTDVSYAYKADDWIIVDHAKCISRWSETRAMEEPKTKVMMSGIDTAKTEYLDRLASDVFGLSRTPNETDEQLRTRIQKMMETSIQGYIGQPITATIKRAIENEIKNTLKSIGCSVPMVECRTNAHDPGVIDIRMDVQIPINYVSDMKQLDLPFPESYTQVEMLNKLHELKKSGALEELEKVAAIIRAEEDKQAFEAMDAAVLGMQEETKERSREAQSYDIDVEIPQSGILTPALIAGGAILGAMISKAFDVSKVSARIQTDSDFDVVDGLEEITKSIGE